MTARSRTAAANGQAALGLAPGLSAGAVFTGRAELDAEGRTDMAWFEAARALMASRIMDGRCPRCGGYRGGRPGPGGRGGGADRIEAFLRYMSAERGSPRNTAGAPGGELRETGEVVAVGAGAPRSIRT